jgi:hypothetical protein
MTRAEEYLFKAAELNDIADREKDPTLKTGFQQLAFCYIRLAEEVERNKQSSMANLMAQTGNAQTH